MNGSKGYPDRRPLPQPRDDLGPYAAPRAPTDRSGEPPQLTAPPPPRPAATLVSPPDVPPPGHPSRGAKEG